MFNFEKINYKNLAPIICSLVSLIILIGLISLNKDFKIDMKSNVINAGDNYENAFTATFRGYDVTKDVKLESNIYDTSLGKYQVTFIYINNGKEHRITKTVEIKDLIAPVISLHGGDEIIMKVNDTYNELGYSAVDNYDANVTDKVVISGSVNTNNPGVYNIKYSIKDSSNNSSSKIRKITVLDKLPTEMSEEEFNLNGLFENTILKEKKSVTDKTMKNYTYIGDSSVSLYSTYSLLDIDNVWYGSDLKIDNVETSSIIIDGVNTEKNLYENILKRNPKTIILSFECDNNVDTNNFIENYTKLVTKLKSIYNGRIVVMSVNNVSIKSNISIKKINDINFYLAEMCNRNEVYFMYANEKLTRSEDNYLSDGVTLSKKGVTILYNYIKSHIRKGD